MVTIFTNPRPFVGPFDLIQRNAIKSWLALRPQCEIILFNDEENTTPKVAKEFGVGCITDVACNEFGTPLLSDVFAKTRNIAKHDILAQVNTDIILMNDFLKAIEGINQWTTGKPFFMVGRRYDLDVTEPLNFNESEWQEKLLKRIQKEGKLHGMAGVDYWVFPKNFNFNPPPFNVGRVGMDSWLIYKARISKIPVIEATEAVTIIHQNHDYPAKRSESFFIETERNLKLAGAFNLMTMRDANWLLTPTGIKKPPLKRRVISSLSTFYPWRLILALKRKVQRAFA